MAIELQPNRRLILEASEVRRLTGWGDAMIIDYQGILQDLIDITAQVNDQDGDFQTQIDELFDITLRIEQLVSVLATDKLQSMIVATNKRAKNMEQQFYVG